MAVSARSALPLSTSNTPSLPTCIAMLPPAPPSMSTFPCTGRHAQAVRQHHGHAWQRRWHPRGDDWRTTRCESACRATLAGPAQSAARNQGARWIPLARRGEGALANRAPSQGLRAKRGPEQHPCWHAKPRMMATYVTDVPRRSRVKFCKDRDAHGFNPLISR